VEGGPGKGKAGLGGRQRVVVGADNHGRALLRPEVLERKSEGVLVWHWDAGQAAVVEADIVVPPLDVGVADQVWDRDGGCQTGAGDEYSGVRKTHGRNDRWSLAFRWTMCQTRARSETSDE